MERVEVSERSRIKCLPHGVPRLRELTRLGRKLPILGRLFKIIEVILRQLLRTGPRELLDLVPVARRRAHSEAQSGNDLGTKRAAEYGIAGARRSHMEPRRPLARGRGARKARERYGAITAVTARSSRRRNASSLSSM